VFYGNCILRVDTAQTGSPGPYRAFMDQVSRHAEAFPMGLNPCLYFANFHLFSCELEFLQRVLQVYESCLAGSLPRLEALQVLELLHMYLDHRSAKRCF
jgi:hypothetical protein